MADESPSRVAGFDLTPSGVLIPPTASRCSGVRAVDRTARTTTSFKPTRRIAPIEASLLDSERPEVCRFAS